MTAAEPCAVCAAAGQPMISDPAELLPDGTPRRITATLPPPPALAPGATA